MGEGVGVVGEGVGGGVLSEEPQRLEREPNPLLCGMGNIEAMECVLPAHF